MNVACALVDRYDFKPGTAVSICHDNSDHLLILACAVLCVGGMVASLYSKDPYPELLYLARKVEPKFLFCHKEKIGWAKQLQADLGHSVVGIVMDKVTDQAADGAHFEDLFWYDHTKSKSRQQIPVPCKDPKKQVALITMSSGTSGHPKAVAQTHWNVLADLYCNAVRKSMRLRFICCASLDYVSGRIILFGAINSGYTAIILNDFEPRSFLQACERFKAQVIYLGAVSFYNLITYKHLENYDISSVKCVFPMGAKVIYLKELAEFFKRHPHVVQVRQGYGASEVSGVAMNSMTPEEYLRDSENCGRINPGMRAKIVDPKTGRSLGPGQEGILHIHGETVFPGYYDRGQARGTRHKRQLVLQEKEANLDESGANGNERAEAEEDANSYLIKNSEIFDEDGFYITGDCAYFNEKEELYFKGRQKEMMVCRGQKKVLPQELESIIVEHPAVYKACVLGIPNRRNRSIQCPRAFVVPTVDCYTEAEPPLVCRLSKSAEESEEADSERSLVHSGNPAHKLNSRMSPERRHLIVEDLMRFTNERLGWEKQLTGGIVLLDDIPISRATGKFNKNFLRALSLINVEIYGDQTDCKCDF